MADMRSVSEPSSVGGSAMGGRDPWAGFAAGPSSGSYPTLGNGSEARGDDRPVADLARRLQDRVDGQEALLDRVAVLAQLADDRARIAELRDITRRLRRDSEALLLLCGADPGVHRGAPHTVPTVLGDAVALVDEPSRVSVARAPSATLAGSAAVELRHLVAELVDEAAAASPGARVEVDARLEPDGALAVDVVVTGRGWTDALGASRGTGGASAVAERLARRSTGGIRLERPLIDQREGVVATLLCPAALITRPAGNDPWYLAGDSTHLMTSALPGSALYGHDGPRNGGDELFGPLPTSVGVVGDADLRSRRVGVVPRRRARAGEGRLGHRGRPRVAGGVRARHPYGGPADHRQRPAAAQPGRPPGPAAPRLPPVRAARRAGARAGPRPAVDLPARPAAGPPPRRRRGTRLRRVGGVDRRRLVAAVA